MNEAGLSTHREWMEPLRLENFKGLGDLGHWTPGDQGLLIHDTGGAQLSISVLTPQIVRILASFGGMPPRRPPSLAVADRAWPTVGTEIREDATTLALRTGELTVMVQKSPLGLRFMDPLTGRIINEDLVPIRHDPAGSAFAITKKLGFTENFYGLGEKAFRLNKRRGYFQMWNLDRPGYKEGTDPLYQSIPFYIGLEEKAAYGIFLDNPSRSFFDFGNHAQDRVTFGAWDGEIDYYFLWGPRMRTVVSRFTELTGRMPMVPRWALGNQQSRYSYYPAETVEKVVATYRSRGLPLDVVYLDIHHMNGFRVFTWDPDRFSDPKGLVERLRQQGVKVVCIVDPGVKHQPPCGETTLSPMPELEACDRRYFVFDQGREGGYFLKRPSGETFIGEVWSGKSVFVDYTLPEASRWWGDLHRAYTGNGVSGIWMDMNEPADFLDQTGQTHSNVLFHDGGRLTPMTRMRNLFALLQARATHEGLLRLRPGQRPYVITRAGYAGIQKYSTMWTGDNTSTWESLALSLPMFQSLGLSGQPFVGADIGGFIGRCTGELLARWYQVGFLTPFCRNHEVPDEFDQEPWRFGTYWEDIIRRYLKLRYRLLPFLYNLLEEAHRTGLPMFRALVLNFPQDENTYDLDDQFMAGDTLLVAPVLGPNTEHRNVYLPDGLWYDFWTKQTVTGGRMITVKSPLETVPFFVRGGAILPMGPELQYVDERPTDPLTLDLYPDAMGSAFLSLYEDDGESLDYQAGLNSRLVVSLDRGPQARITCTRTGPFNPGPRRFRFILRGTPLPGQIVVDGIRLEPDQTQESRWWMDEGSLVIEVPDTGKDLEILVR